MNIRIFSYIVGGIVGTGIFLLPSTIISFGWSSVFSLIASSCVFCGLGYLFSCTNKPFDDMYEQIPSRRFNNIVSLGYWILSWSSTIVVFYEMAQPLYYLIFGSAITTTGVIVIQLCLTFLFMGIQLLGSSNVSKIEIIVTIGKIIASILVPLLFIGYYMASDVSKSIATCSFNGVISTFPSMMWMFLGIECCSLLHGTKKTSSMVYAVITICIIYLLNIVAVLLNMSIGDTYPSLMNRMFASGDIIMSLVIVLLCFGSSNSWFTSSTVTLQALSDRGVVSDKFLSYRNAMIASSVGLIPLSIVVNNPDAKVVFESVIDIFTIIAGIFYICVAYAVMRKYNKKIVGISVISVLSAFVSYKLITMLI